eukprot:CAMPEP_0116108288 /NCGR_PEP_ID=MMETSP0327-20121206/16703_1 /TAXON_ID=44447 /ORGANISM="Pseudo-nitzschia delicatissima, Strain B596" /LENGTH=358 /DNA_ID=CAMNT_0003601185 /DNA_START=97 /DNA_END=1170 /DNA_ORIENTATION=+
MTKEPRSCPCKFLSTSLSSFTAAEYGDIHSLSKIKDVTTRSDDAGYNPLHFTAQFNHVAATALLLQMGCPVDGGGHCGATPLHRASFSGATATMKVLLEWNAPNKTYSETTDTEMAFVEDIASDSRTPASATQSKARYCDLLARDTSFGDESTPLHKAAAGGRYLAVHMILGALKERNSATSNGLSSAPKNSWIQRGLLARDKYGRTPLDVARHFLQIQETERDAVARWDEVAGGSADWGKCAKMLENATTENKRNSIGNPSSRNQAIPGLPLHLRRGVMACLDCTGLPGQNDNVCMTASWQASFQKALGNSASMCIVASTSVPSMPKTVASILIANTKTSSVAMNENNATRKEGIEW